MSQPLSALVCFAVREEAKPFLRKAGSWDHVRTLVTGMGCSNAAAAVREAFAQGTPALVLSCGFAGGLASQLAFGTVVYDVDPQTGIETAMRAAGGVPVRFACVDAVATTAAQKRELRSATGADAVEMESEAIRSICRAKGIPGATIRVILDTADEDLPLDFNSLMNERKQIDGRKLALAMIKSPGKIPALLEFQKRAGNAANTLAEALEGILAR